LALILANENAETLVPVGFKLGKTGFGISGIATFSIGITSIGIDSISVGSKISIVVSS
jgi:hypothetical protein